LWPCTSQPPSFNRGMDKGEEGAPLVLDNGGYRVRLGTSSSFCCMHQALTTNRLGWSRSPGLHHRARGGLPLC
jgi:hypothetical protein